MWQQYTELAFQNPSYRAVLLEIDPSLPDYIGGDFIDEQSHASFINAFLVAHGAPAVNLDPYRTIFSPPVRGLAPIGRLTNLRALNVDTSFFNRYRGRGNPDFGDVFPQAANIAAQPTIPTSDRDSGPDLFARAQSAAFHFGSIEQGGSSLYTALIPKVSDPDVLAILAAIGPTEVYHLSLFQSSLENIVPFNIPGRPAFPNIRGNPLRAFNTPHPCTYLNTSFPVCSVIRPSSIQNAGAVATANFLVKSNLFAGQSTPATGPYQGQTTDFLTAVTNLAVAADAAQRSF